MKLPLANRGTLDIDSSDRRVRDRFATSRMRSLFLKAYNVLHLNWCRAVVFLLCPKSGYALARAGGLTGWPR